MNQYADADIYDDTLDEFDESSYTIGSDEVREYVEEQGAVSIGALSRKFPDYRRYLMSILKQLRVAGHIFYDDYKPAPTLVFAGNTNRPTQYSHTWRSMRDLTWAQRVARSKASGH